MDAKFGKTKDTGQLKKALQDGWNFNKVSVIESHQKAELLYFKHSFLIEQPTCTQLKLHAF